MSGLSGDDLWLPRTASTIKFREIRRTVAEMMQIDESTIRPETRLAAIVPPYRRDEVLRAIVAPRDRPAPPTRPRQWPIWCAEILISAVLSLVFLFQPWFLVLLTIPISLIIAGMLRSPQSTFWPPALETMQELALSQTHYNEKDAKRGLWPREEISAKVRWIIANQLGYSFDEITEETRIIDLE